MEKRIKSSLQIKIITCNYDYIYCVLYSSRDIIAYVTRIGSRITLAHHLCIKNFHRVCYRFEDGHLFWQKRCLFLSQWDMYPLYKISVLFSQYWEDVSFILSCTYPCRLNDLGEAAPFSLFYLW